MTCPDWFVEDSLGRAMTFTMDYAQRPVQFKAESALNQITCSVNSLGFVYHQATKCRYSHIDSCGLQNWIKLTQFYPDSNESTLKSRLKKISGEIPGQWYLRDYFIDYKALPHLGMGKYPSLSTIACLCPLKSTAQDSMGIYRWTSAERVMHVPKHLQPCGLEDWMWSPI